MQSLSPVTSQYLHSSCQTRPRYWSHMPCKQLSMANHAEMCMLQPRPRQHFIHISPKQAICFFLSKRLRTGSPQERWCPILQFQAKRSCCLPSRRQWPNMAMHARTSAGSAWMLAPSTIPSSVLAIVHDLRTPSASQDGSFKAPAKWRKGYAGSATWNCLIGARP